MTSPPPRRGYIIILAGTFIWAFTGIIVKILLTTYRMDTLTIAFWRVFFVAAFLFLALWLIDARQFRIDRRDVGVFFVYGLIGIGVHQIMWISSVQYNGAAVATVMIYTAPALVGVLAARFLHEGMNRTKVIALGLTIIGCALVARVYDLGQLQLNAVGIAFGLGSACTFATYSLMGRFVTRRYSPWTSLFYAFFFGLLFLLLVDLILGKLLPVALPIDGWGTLVFLALGPTLGGFGAYTFGLSHLPASVASLLAAFEPVTTAILAYTIFGEVLEPFQLIGAGLILWSVLMLRPSN